MKEYQIQSKGCNLQVYVRGKQSSKTAILFLHGGPGSGAKAITDLPAFQSFEDQYLCIYFDQRASAKSTYDLTKGLSIDQLSDDVLMVVKDIKQRWNIKWTILWGGSFGGFLASLCIECFADEFAGVILSSPAIVFNRNQALDFYNRMKKLYSHRINNLNHLDSLEPEQFFSLPQVKEFIYSDSNLADSLRHICAMAPWFYSHFFEHLFAQIKIPVLILQGKNDNICIYQNIDRQIKKVNNQNIRYYLFDNCGHAVFEDQEKEFINKINQFIKENELC